MIRQTRVDRVRARYSETEWRPWSSPEKGRERRLEYAALWNQIALGLMEHRGPPRQMEYRLIADAPRRPRGRPTKLRRCPQCWEERPGRSFHSHRPSARCAICRENYRGWMPGARVSEPRRRLPIVSDAPPRVLWVPKSHNRKLGPIPSTIVSGETCPPSCGLYGKGCYAEFGFLGAHWRRTSEEGIPWADFLERVRALPAGQLWRYAVAGDLPGDGDNLDTSAFAGLVLANQGRRGFTFTHKPLRRAAETSLVANANELGFVVNLSADTLAQADERAELRAGPVTVLLPADASGDIRTPAGRRVVVCPAQRIRITCEQCKLCADPKRRGIVGFLAHGQMEMTVSRIATGKSAEKP